MRDEDRSVRDEDRSVRDEDRSGRERTATMARSADPTEPIREKAASFPDVANGTSCNQSSFKAGKGSFLFIGPGAKGVGFKAMFKLAHSMSQARQLATKEPDRFEVGSTGWVTTRFTAEKPLPMSIWEKWLKESYDICCGSSKGKKPVKKKSAKKKSAKKKSAKKKSAKTKPAAAKKKR